MAKRKNKTGMWIALAAIAGGAVWYFTRKPAAVPAAPPPATLPPTVTIPTNTAPTPATPVVPAVLDMPATPVVSGGYPGDPAGGITDAQKAEILPRIQGTVSPANWAQFQAVMNQFAPAEWWGLYDLYGNVPNNGFNNMTSARIAFWQAWRTKYHVLDGTYP